MALLLSYKNNAQNIQHMTKNELFTWLCLFFVNKRVVWARFYFVFGKLFREWVRFCFCFLLCAWFQILVLYLTIHEAKIILWSVIKVGLFAVNYKISSERILFQFKIINWIIELGNRGTWWVTVEWSCDRWSARSTKNR